MEGECACHGEAAEALVVRKADTLNKGFFANALGVSALEGEVVAPGL